MGTPTEGSRVRLGITISLGTQRMGFGTFLSTLGSGALNRLPKGEHFLSFVFLRDSRATIPCSVKPGIPFTPNCRYVPAHASEAPLGRIGVPRGHKNFSPGTSASPPERRKPGVHGRYLFHLHSWLYVCSQHSPTPHRYCRLVPSLGPFRRKCVCFPALELRFVVHILTNCFRGRFYAALVSARQPFRRSRFQAPGHRCVKCSEHCYSAKACVPHSFLRHHRALPPLLWT